jgi:hypothetical protein
MTTPPFTPSDIVFGAVPSPDDYRDWPPSALAPDWDLLGLTLPDRARAKDVPVPPYDQDGTPACVCASGAGNQTIEEMSGPLRFNWAELYARCKEQDGDPKGAGTYIRVAAKIRQDRGMLSTTGQFHKIKDYARLPLTFLDFETAIFLASEQANPRIGGAPWTCGNWPSNWMASPASGVLPHPVFSSSPQGHAFDIVEYWRSHPSGRCFKILNSWGPWALKGEVWVTYDDLMSVLWEGWKTTDAPDPEAKMIVTNRRPEVHTVTTRTDIRSIEESADGTSVAYLNCPFQTIEAGTLGGRYPGPAYSAVDRDGKVRWFLLRNLNVLK